MKMTKAEYYSKDYDLSKYKEDWRLVQCKKEALITVCIELLMAAIFFTIEYTMGAGDPKQFSYLFGIPMWAALIYILLAVGMAVEIYLSRKVFVNFPFDDEGAERKEDSK